MSSQVRLNVSVSLGKIKYECKGGLGVSFKKCKGNVKLIKFHIYTSFTSALHHSKVMFSCCRYTRAATKDCIHQTHASS